MAQTAARSRRGCAHTRRRLQDRGALVAAVCPAETQSTRHRATAAALRSIVDGYRATVGAFIDADTIDRHRGGEIVAARVCAHSRTASRSPRTCRCMLCAMNDRRRAIAKLIAGCACVCFAPFEKGKRISARIVPPFLRGFFNACFVF